MALHFAWRQLPSVLALAVLFGVVCGCRFRPTQVTLVFDSNVASERRVTLSLVALEGSRSIDELRAADGSLARRTNSASALFPGSAAVVPRTDRPRSGTMTMLAVLDAPEEDGIPAFRIERVQQLSLIEHVPQQARVFFNVECSLPSSDCTSVPASQCTLSQRCIELGQTCGDDATCVPIALPTVTVPPTVPLDAVLATDASSPRRSDASMLDVPRDTPTVDARSVDAAPIDASPADAPSVDSMMSDVRSQDADVADVRGTISLVSVTPSHLLPAGGDIELSLAGNLMGLAVSVDGLPCAALVMLDATRARCTAPARVAGVVPVTATSVVGSSTLPTGIAYVTPGPQQMGGPADDRTSGVAVDRQGNVYLSGGTTGSLDGASAGDFDALIVKYDASGRLVWTRQLGTNTFDYARDVAIDGATGDVLVVGYGSGDIDGDSVAMGGTDVFVARYNSSGTRVWVRQIGSAGNDESWDLAVDAAGNAVVSIWTDGAFAGATNAGGLDYAVARFTRAGVLSWVRQVGTTANDQAHSVAVAPDGTAYIVGYTTGVLEVGVTNAGLDDLFIARYDTAGTRTWIRQRGTTTSDRAFDVTVDSMGRPWLVGTTGGALDGQPNAGGADVFIMRYSSAGAWELTRTRGSTGNEATFGVAVNSAGRAFLSCTTPAAFDGQSYAGGSNDYSVVAWNADGTHAFTRIAGSTGTDSASAITLASNDLLYVSIVTDGSLDGRPSRGGNDVAVTRFRPSTASFF